jgi:hypothetical protein
MRGKVLLALFLACWPLLAAAETGLQPYSASYRLLFDGEVVGDSFFRLKLMPGQGYRFEAYTLPIEKGDPTQGHEILESSTGRLQEDGGVRPNDYYFSVFDDGEASLLEFRFDWAAQALRLRSSDQNARLELLPDTQDRLSYLLALGRWLATQETETRFPIAQPGVTAVADFVRIDSSTIEVEAGRFETVHLLRVDAGESIRRELWLELAPPHRLIALERHEPNGIARMELIPPGAARGDSP